MRCGEQPTHSKSFCALRRQWMQWRAAPPRLWRPPCAKTRSSCYPHSRQIALRAAQAVDAVAGSTTALVAASVRNDGLVLVYGALAGFKLELGVADLLFRGVRVHGFWCAARNPTLL